MAQVSDFYEQMSQVASTSQHKSLEANICLVALLNDYIAHIFHFST